MFGESRINLTKVDAEVNVAVNPGESIPAFTVKSNS